MGELENQGVIVLELAVCQATQYKFAIFFKNENPSETTLGVLILLWVLLYSKKIVSAREASPCADDRRNFALEPQPYFRHI